MTDDRTLYQGQSLDGTTWRLSVSDGQLVMATETRRGTRAACAAHWLPAAATERVTAALAAQVLRAIAGGAGEEVSDVTDDDGTRDADVRIAMDHLEDAMELLSPHSDGHLLVACAIDDLTVTLSELARVLTGEEDDHDTQR